MVPVSSRLYGIWMTNLRSGGRARAVWAPRWRIDGPAPIKYHDKSCLCAERRQADSPSRHPRGASADKPSHRYSSVAQRQSIRLLTGGLLVRIQPEEPFFFGNLIKRPLAVADCDVDCDIAARSAAGTSFIAACAVDGGGVTGAVAEGSSASAAWFSASRRMWL